MSQIVAVITGDIVGSSRTPISHREEQLAALRTILEQSVPAQKQQSWEIFRGDSFQLLLPDPSTALRAAIRIRCGLRVAQPPDLPDTWDARMGIGIGEISRAAASVSESDGEAFRRSGGELDALKGENRLSFRTGDRERDRELNTASALLDALISKWTAAQAETVLGLTENKVQQTIADELGISQAAIHYRVKGAGWFAITTFLDRFAEIIGKTDNKP